jgi:hypothetical protein
VAERAPGPDSASDDPALAIAARHALHDEELIAALADGSAEPDEAGRAAALVERCAACRDLHADLLLIRAALRASGTAAQVGAVIHAPRDFRIAPPAAGRAHPASPLGRLINWLADAIGAFGRPMGSALATFGLVGLLVGTVGFGGFGGTAAAPREGVTTTSTGAGDQPGATHDSQWLGPVASLGATDHDGGSSPPTDTARLSSSNGVWLLLASGLVLVLGLLLFVAGGRARAQVRT